MYLENKEDFKYLSFRNCFFTFSHTTIDKIK